MGYILPVHHNQYKQYANTWRRKDKHPFYIHSTSYKNTNRRGDFDELVFGLLQYEDKDPNFKQKKERREVSLYDLTGKGKFINKTI